MSAASRNKGASGERELAGALFEELGVRLVRRLDQTRAGGHDLEPAPGQSGAVAALMGTLAIESKRYRAVSPGLIKGWWEQAARQARVARKTPVLAYRADRGEWRVRVPLSLIQPGLDHGGGPEWSAELSLAGFCFLIREAA